jgi:hypothetical protein
MHSPRIVCVLGMHRSGTSLLARVLNLLGVYLGPDDHLMAPAADNPKGFWEHRQVLELNEAILKRFGGAADDPPNFPAGWASAAELEDLRNRARTLIHHDFGAAGVWGWKDSRTCLTLPFWQHLLPDMHYVLCFREPWEVVQSLQRRNGYSLAKGLHLWVASIHSALLYTAGGPRTLVFFEDILADWQPEVRRLAGFLGMSEGGEHPDVQEAIAAFIDKNLRHHHRDALPTDQVALDAAGRALAVAQDVYARLRQARVVEAGYLLRLGEALDLLAPLIKAEKQRERRAREQQIARVNNALLGLIPPGDLFLLADEEEMRGELALGSQALPFLEQDGEYWGRPEDDTTAIHELERLRRAGAAFIVFAWPAFWWLDYYSRFHQYLRARFRCLLQNELLVVFDLRRDN